MGTSDDGVIVSDPAGAKFRIRTAKRGSYLRDTGTSLGDGTVHGLVVALVLAVIGKVFTSFQNTSKIGVYRLVGPPKMRPGGPVYRERLRAVHKEKVHAGDSSNVRVLRIQELIEAGRFQDLLQDAG